MEIGENIFYKEEQNNPKLVIHYEQFAIKGITQNEMRMYGTLARSWIKITLSEL